MSTVIKQGLRQQQKSLSERVSGIEQNLARILFGVNQKFTGAEQRLNVLEEMVNALIALQGKEDVETYVNNERIEKARAGADAERRSLEEAIADGYVSKVETAGEKSLLVARYLDKDGKPVEPGRTQLVMPGIQENFRAQLMDKGAGFSIDLPDGGKFEVLEVYAVDEEKAKTVMEAKQQAAIAAAAQAATAQAAADEQKDTGEPAVETPAETPAPAAG